MSKLYLVPTPIGNLQDMTFRAIEVLKSCDHILAEDTRKTIFLMKHYGIEKPVRSHHKFNEHKSLEFVIRDLLSGQTIALVSDAGTPGISDPGFLLVRECLKNSIPVECLPGATALIPALVNSGLPSDKFCFEGFLPQKKGRMTRLLELKEESRTMVFYESPYRLLKTLEQFIEIFGPDRICSVSRELSKMYEENKHGTLSEVLAHFKAKTVKGEIVIVLAGTDTV
ncbi:MAG: 16S rRNA (cytidine(1402)-2'-O)-methyltransferase [Bacteroidales bacterium]|nr:16S rRNA (cytidine(1402)-2'-O)-methyltransferase [Bacteroidales bacterium]MCB9013180.1 16S rRNA (cytidine(1402)-2'-O)-methyltransferase [Bacteroidales bacterium]